MTHEPLPLRSAMHRDVPKGSRLEIANAYAIGELMTEAEWIERLHEQRHRGWKTALARTLTRGRYEEALGLDDD